MAIGVWAAVWSSRAREEGVGWVGVLFYGAERKGRGKSVQ